ncbi:uncharacterized protein LOC111085009 [Limulus polyphemus]|uniref:Uncharacterized protein LOC111085009 n=1 Tax=Limulus polyphemus TaxID=6850 RepID=A0ABM1S1Y1_LIMPO|nr:uncharacterized protein LOC111085009 [Limulus polyphemus]
MSCGDQGLVKSVPFFPKLKQLAFSLDKDVNEIKKHSDSSLTRLPENSAALQLSHLQEELQTILVNAQESSEKLHHLKVTGDKCLKDTNNIVAEITEKIAQVEEVFKKYGFQSWTKSEVEVSSSAGACLENTFTEVQEGEIQNHNTFILSNSFTCESENTEGENVLNTPAISTTKKRQNFDRTPDLADFNLKYPTRDYSRLLFQQNVPRNNEKPKTMSESLEAIHKEAAQIHVTSTSCEISLEAPVFSRQKVDITPDFCKINKQSKKLTGHKNNNHDVTPPVPQQLWSEKTSASIRRQNTPDEPQVSQSYSTQDERRKQTPEKPLLLSATKHKDELRIQTPDKPLMLSATKHKMYHGTGPSYEVGLSSTPEPPEVTCQFLIPFSLR